MLGVSSCSEIKMRESHGTDQDMRDGVTLTAWVLDAVVLLDAETVPEGATLDIW